MNKLLANIFALLMMVFLMGACKDKVLNDLPAELISFSVVDQNGTNHDLSVNTLKSTVSSRESFPSYVNLSSLVPQFKLNRADAVVKINDVQLQSGKGQINLSNDLVCDLYVDDSKERSYVIRIMKETMANTFRSFGFSDPVMEQFSVVIDEQTGEIYNTVVIPKNVNITDLQPVFTLSESRSAVKVNGVKQIGGVQRHDFSKPVIYTVEGEDGSSRSYTVNLNQGDFFAIKNPVIAGSYADPTAIRVGNEMYVYVTGTRVRGYRSSDLINWRSIGPPSEVFTIKPAFTADANQNDVGMWAPDINYFDGKYVMYYSLSAWGGGANSGIGVAVSNQPQGPFVHPTGNTNGKLFVSSEIGVHNSIDPCFYEENGKRYLFWGSFFGMYMTELTSDGMAIKDMSAKTKVAGDSFEGAYVHKRGNYYYLFASAGTCCEALTSTYRVVVGRSTNLAGPYVNRNGVDMKDFNARYNSIPTYNPIVLQGNQTFVGPGHNARIITDKNGVDWMLYHAYENVNNVVGSRNLMLGKVNWDSDGWPIVDNGTPSAILTDMPVF